MDDHNFQVPLMKQNWIESAFNKLFPSHITEMTSRETEKKHCGTFSTIGSRVLYVYHEKPFLGGSAWDLGIEASNSPIHQVAFFLRREFSIHNVRQTQRSPPASSILCVGKVDKSLGLEVSISSEDRGRLHIQHSN